MMLQNPTLTHTGQKPRSQVNFQESVTEVTETPNNSNQTKTLTGTGVSKTPAAPNGGAPAEAVPLKTPTHPETPLADQVSTGCVILKKEASKLFSSGGNIKFGSE